MHGPHLLAAALSNPDFGTGAFGRFAHDRTWQYHPRSDRHSKVACWGVLFDLMLECPLLRRHVEERRVGFGINHEMRDFARNRKKNLDLVLCRATAAETPTTSFSDLAKAYGVALDTKAEMALASLPMLWMTSPTAVLLAVEAKACMTEHGKARPRLYDELNSSHLMIHGDTDDAIAAGLAIVNGARAFTSPLRNPWALGEREERITLHKQPDATINVVEKLKELPRRTRPGEVGYDAFGLIVLECANDGSRCNLLEIPSSGPGSAAIFDYGQFVQRLAQIYATRFAGL